MNNPRGIPLLSGIPPDYSGAEPSCRKCDKEFNILFERKRRCNHCGYSYCSTCSNYQALMPRDSGYDPVAVCAYCIENLTITAAGKSYLKSLPLAKLKKYVDAYNLKADRVVEKDDLVDILMSIRRPNGCLPQANEDYYRKHSVPNRSTVRSRSIFSRTTGPPPQTGPRPSQPSIGHYFPRPDVDPQWQPPPPPPSHSRPTAAAPRNQPQPSYNTRPQQQPPPPPPRPASSNNLNVPTPNTQTRPRATSAGPASAPPPPTLDRLLEMAPDDISSLPISMLKSILFSNHVNARLLIEKSDLVERVKTLVDEERKDRQRDAMYREMEEAAERARLEEIERERLQAEQPPIPQVHTEADDSNDTDTTALDTSGLTDELEPDVKPPATPPKPVPKPTQAQIASTLERNGLCIICQDEEANIAIVDCGHMAMCRGCSDLIMNSTRECPLCRTRIVTEARLLRIFKA